MPHQYLDMRGFGGPAPYRVDFEVVHLLDLRREPWAVMEEEFGMERARLRARRGGPRNLLGIGEAVPGCRLSLGHFYVESHPEAEEWMYVCEQPLPARRTALVPARKSRRG